MSDFHIARQALCMEVSYMLHRVEIELVGLTPVDHSEMSPESLESY